MKLNNNNNKYKINCKTLILPNSIKLEKNLIEPSIDYVPDSLIDM